MPLFGNLANRILQTENQSDKAVSDYIGSKNIAYINVANKLSIDCDCSDHPKDPEMKDIGIFASIDPVALDQACADLCNQMKPIPESVLGQNMKSSTACDHEHGHDCDHEEHNDVFTMTHPDTEWTSCIEHAVKIGLGTNEYELHTI